MKLIGNWELSLGIRSKKAAEAILTTLERIPVIRQQALKFEHKCCPHLRRVAWKYTSDYSCSGKAKVRRSADGDIILHTGIRMTDKSIKGYCRTLGEFMKEALLNADEFKWHEDKSYNHFEDKCKALPELTLGEVFCIIDIMHGLLPATVRNTYGRETYAEMTEARINPFQLAQRQSIIDELAKLEETHKTDEWNLRKKYEKLLNEELDKINSAYTATKTDLESKLSAMN